MRLSNLFTKTSRDYPSDETSKNAQLLIRAGFVHKTMPGVYAMLPLGVRVLSKIEAVVHKHMKKIGGQESLLNMLHPKELWVMADNRWETLDILFRLKSQTEAEYALAQSNEEQITNIARGYINSWKDLPEFDKDPSRPPLAVYQIQTKFRDEIRSKAGLMRGREFRMKDMYDFHQTTASQDAYYEVVKQAYLDIYSELGLDAFAVRASGGAFSKFSHEFQVITDAGEDWTVLWSDGVKDNLEISKGYPTDTHSQSLGEKQYREGLLDNVKTVQQHAAAADLTDDRILKSVLFVTTEEKPRFIGVAIRGDLEVNEELIIQAVDAGVRVAEDSELEALGSQRGRFSPIKEVAEKYSKPVHWIFDESLRDAAGMASSYYTQVDVVRDLVEPATWECVSVVREGFVRNDNPQIICEAVKRSAEVGNIFKLGTKWTKAEAMDVSFSDKENKLQRPLMSCYGIGVTRCMGTIVEVSSDDKGIIWPETVAPFQFHLITHINPKDEETINNQIRTISRDFYLGNLCLYAEDETFTVTSLDDNTDLVKATFDSDIITPTSEEVLWDDRDGLSMGERLKDADLIGCPIQVVVSKRSLEQGGIEVRSRATGESQIVPIEL
ncbi:MAG: proline--tRNA ligase [Patescibacteria group bacterium]